MEKKEGPETCHSMIFVYKKGQIHQLSVIYIAFQYLFLFSRTSILCYAHLNSKIGIHRECMVT